MIPGGTAPGPSRLAEVARLFLKLGIVGFGGPAAHIACTTIAMITGITP